MAQHKSLSLFLALLILLLFKMQRDCVALPPIHWFVSKLRHSRWIDHDHHQEEEEEEEAKEPYR